MADFQIEVTVTRDEYSLSPLEIIPDNGYYVSRNGIGPGGIQWEKAHATSIFVDGEFLVHKRKQMSTTPMVVMVKATSASQLHSRISTLTQAFEQFQYTMTVNIGGVTYQWTCEAADYEVGDGGSWDDLMLRQYHQAVSFDIPHFPN